MVGSELSRLFVVIGAKTQGFNRSMDGVSNKMQNVSRKMKIAGGIMVAAVAAIGVASIKMAADFDKGMREVNTMMNLSEKEFGEFSKEVQQLARDMGVNAVEAANALYQAISAGIPKENVLEFLEIATKAAIGGVTDTTTAVDVLTTVINAFKIPVSDAQHVADVLFTTVKGGKTTFAELAASMFNVAPIAAAAGVKFEEVAAALASITKQGVPTAVAATQLRAAIQAVTAPTIRQRKMIEELGIEMSAAALQSRGLAGTFNILMEATGGNMEMLRKLVGSVEAVQAILALTGVNAEVFAADLEAMANAGGAATFAFEQMEKTTSRQMAKLKAKLQDVGITIGTALIPSLTKIVNYIIPIIQKIGDWIAKHTNLTVAILAGVAALGALLLVGGILLPMLSTAIASLHLVAAAQWAWNIAMAANPLGLLIAAIGLLVVGIIAISRHWRDITKTVKEQLEEQTRLVQEHSDKQKQAILDTYNLRTAIIDAETQAKLDALQAEEDAIRKGERDEQLAAQYETAIKEAEAGDQIALIDWIRDAKLAAIADERVALLASDKEQKLTIETWADNQIAAIDEVTEHFQLLIDKQMEYNKNFGMVTMTEPKFFPPAYPHIMSNLTFEPKALGGLITKPTLALLGEKGPEMVVPLSGEAPQAGITNTFHISGMVVREEADIKRIARELYNLQRINARAAGVV